MTFRGWDELMSIPHSENYGMLPSTFTVHLKIRLDVCDNMMFIWGY